MSDRNDRFAHLRLTLTGTRDLLQHNARLVNPLDPHTKAVAALSKIPANTKTDQNHHDVSKAEWFGGLYYNAQSGFYIPSAAVSKCLREAGSLVGKKGKALQRGFMPDAENIALVFDGPTDATPEELWQESERLRGRFAYVTSVKNSGRNGGRVMRTRPRFPKWSLDVTGQLDLSEVSLDVFEEIVDRAGIAIGIGDYRPTFGRFEGTVTKVTP